MKRRTLDEMITHFNQQLSEMDIDRKYKIQLLGMITAIGFDAQKRKWIPCSERLPDAGKHVLVTLKWEKDDYEVTELDYGVDVACGGRFAKRVIAWMPLPEPYQEAEDEQID